MDSIGKRLKYLRKLRKETQKDVAEATGINRGNISHYENDDDVGISNVALKALAKHYNVKVEWLEKGEGAAPDPEIVTLSLNKLDDPGMDHLKNLLKDFISENLSSITDKETINSILKDEKITLLAEHIKEDSNQEPILMTSNKQDFILNEEEKRLISLYRKLDMRSQIKVEGYIEGLLSSSSANQKQTLYTYTPGEEDAAAEEGVGYNIIKDAL